MSTGSSSARKPPSAASGAATNGAAKRQVSGQRNALLNWRARSVAPWAAVGLVVIGGAAGYALAQHGPTPQPQAQTAFCGLVSCAILHSDASAARAPAAHSHARPALSPQDAARGAVAVTPASAPPAAGPPAAGPPAAAPTRTPALRSRPAATRGPVPTPVPAQPPAPRPVPTRAWPPQTRQPSPWWPTWSGWPTSGRHQGPQTWW
jgi:hypothetical protein